MAERKIVEARSPFTTMNTNGVPWQVRAGDLYYDDDPIVRNRAHLFGEPSVQDSTRAGRTRLIATTAHAAPEMAVAHPSGETRTPVTQAGKLAKAGSSPPRTRPAGEV